MLGFELIHFSERGPMSLKRKWHADDISSLVAMEYVKATTSNATSNENFLSMATIMFSMVYVSLCMYQFLL